MWKHEYNASRLRASPDPPIGARSGFTHEPGGSLTEDRARRSPIEAIRDDRTAARNLALLRKIALNLVTGDRRGQASRRGRRKMAAWNDDYMLQIITGQ